MREPLSCPCGPIIYQFDRLSSCLWSRFYEQYCSDIFSQRYLILFSVPCNIGSFELSKF